MHLTHKPNKNQLYLIQPDTLGWFFVDWAGLEFYFVP